MEKTRKCPYCGEEIMADAKKCKHCGEWLNDEADPKQEPIQELEKKEPENQPRNEVIVTTKSIEEPLTEKVPNKPNESLFKSCFWEQITKHYCDFKGNVDRKTFWICYLYYSLIMLVIAGISVIAPLAGTILMTVVSLGLFLPFLGLMVRRLHDIGKKGAWILISLVPLVGAIWLLVLLAKKGETQNPNKWSGKDTIITIAMAVVGCGLFFVPTSSFEFNDDSEYDTDSELSLLDETDIKYLISQMQSDLNANKKPLSSFMDIELKRMYDSVRAKEQEYDVDCECLDIIGQMENGHVIIEPIEIGGIGYNQAVAIVNLKPDKLRNTRVAIGITYEREKSFFSKHRINNLIINSMLIDNGQALRQCMVDWLESGSYLGRDFSYFSYIEDEYGDEDMLGDNEIKAEIIELVLDAYRTRDIYNLESNDFQLAGGAADAADIPGYAPCIDWDYYYCTQDDTPNRVGVTRVDLVGQNNANVHVKLYFDNDGYSSIDSVVLVMVRVYKEGGLQWLVDDVRTTGSSIKELMLECANSANNDDDYEDEIRDQYVVIDGSELRLRLAPSTSSETLKWGDGSNRHPEVGERFRLLDESGDFYKIDYKGNEVWVSKQFSHIEIQ